MSMTFITCGPVPDYDKAIIGVALMLALYWYTKLVIDIHRGRQ